jgi:HipA-like protein
MPRRVEQLGVWLEDDRVAVLEQTKRYAITCRYTDMALARWAVNRPVISCSLPVGDRRVDALPFCRGLLPEGRALVDLRRAGAGSGSR